MCERERPRGAILLALLVPVVVLYAGCQNSDSITGPSVSTSTIISGTWSGTFLSNDPVSRGCTAVAVLQQDGNQLTGTFSTSDCGVTGAFNGRIDDQLVTGKVVMGGCVGGGVSGSLRGSELVLTVGDLTKELTTGDKVDVIYGGSVTLRR